MSNSFLDGAGRGRRAVVVIVIAISAVALVAVVGALVLFANRQGDPLSTAPLPNVTADVPVGPLTQIKGQRTVDGVSVGYPHTAAGAVSAASEYMAQLGSTLDLDRIRTIAAIVADPSYGDAEDRLRQGRVESRKQLGVPESGPVPANASMTVGPASFQLRSVTTDQMTVLLLAYLTTTDVAGSLTPRVIVMPVDMHWDGSDWKLLGPGASLSFPLILILAVFVQVRRAWRPVGCIT